MLQIKSTKKLLDEMKIKPSEIQDIDPLFSWHSNIKISNRKKAVYLINDATRMIIVLRDLKAADFKKLDSLILDAIRENLALCKIGEDIIKKYMDIASKEIIYTKTDDRSIIATLNLVIEDARWVGPNSVNIKPKELSNEDYLKYTVRVGDSFYKPIDLAHKYFDEFGKKDSGNYDQKIAKANKAYEFKLQMNLMDYDVWRNIIVPAGITFKKFHFVLQDVFGWFNYHLHEFTVFNEEEEPRGIALIAMGKDVDPPDYIDVYEESIKLEKFIPEYKKILYAYDFGDGWEVFCDLVRVVEDYEFNYATCTDGKGDSPPEDVGGDTGFKDFLEIINDKDNPEYDEMVKWGKMQHYEKWNIESVNKRLVKSLKRTK
ncbi:MAG: plasmid pRiA4b ORF-3 family protein [Oscillospiraceae bacterium]|nr:plasmid pRiA4b ORF-3 family protein [Oscillospiraceae bacterium]